MEKSTKPEQNLKRLSKFIDQITSFPFDDHAARIYGKIRSKLETVGTPIGPNDLIIAAIVLSNKLTLVTNNTKEFRRIEGIELGDWEIS